MPRTKKAESGTQIVVGERMREARDRAKLNQFEVAEQVRALTKEWPTGQVRIGPTDVSRLESGKGPDVAGSRVKAFALVLGCSTDYLLGLSAKPK